MCARVCSGVRDVCGVVSARMSAQRVRVRASQRDSRGPTVRSEKCTLVD